MLNNQLQFSKAWKVFCHPLYEYFEGTIDFSSHTQVFISYCRQWRSLDLCVAKPRWIMTHYHKLFFFFFLPFLQCLAVTLTAVCGLGEWVWSTELDVFFFIVVFFPCSIDADSVVTRSSLNPSATRAGEPKQTRNNTPKSAQHFRN